MKTILSLVTAFSVLFSQLNAPVSVTVAQETNITETVSASPTPSETQSPMPSVTEDAKGTPTSPPTPALPVETSSPEVTPTPEIDLVENETPILSLRAEPDYVTVGANKTLYWEVSEESLKEQLELQITLTEGLSLEKQGEMRFDETSRIVFIPVNSQNGELHLLAGDVNSDLVIYAALVTENGEIRSETKLFLPVKETFIFDEQGGVLVAEEGRVKVEIPKDALVATSSIAIGKPAGDSIPPFSLSGDPFEITAHGETSKEEQTQFSKEIMISVSYANLEIPEALEGNLYLYWYNPDIKDWQALPTTVDRKSKTIEGFTDHFTVFDINVNNWQSSRAPTVDSFQVSSFTGAATYSLPIEVPPGPGGFQPNLELSYNSQIVDQSTTATQASWVGMGWSLDTGSINLDSHGTYYDSDDTFFLNVAGVSTRLLKDASGVYHSIDENFWRIQESAGGGFEVWDKQGNIYYFQSGAPFPYEVGSCAGGDLWIEWDNHTWMLTKIKNSFGQEILYTYADQTRSVRLAEYIESEGRCYGSDYTGVTAKYPATITYAGGKYRIRLDKGSTPNRFDYRSGWDAGGAFQIYQKYRLQNVYVEQDVDGDGTFETVLRRYEFEYESDTNTANLIFPGFVWTAGGKTSTLKSVKQYGVGGSTALPATTFTYGDNLHLTRADNGYGGAVEFDYGFWYLPDVARNSYSITQLFGKSGYPCRLEDPSPWGPSGVGSDVNCGDGYKDNLHVRGTAGAGWIKNAPSASNQNTSQDLIRPGGMYKLTASVYMADTTSLRVGFYDGVNSNLLATGSPYYLMLPVGASTLSPLIEITGGTGYGQVGGFTLQLLPSVYRVTTKRLLDGNGHSYQFTYDYTNNGVDTAKFNDAYVVTSEACTHWSCVDNYFNEKYSEFRGNGKVTVTAADGTKTITEFHQDDIFKGRPISTISNDGAANIVETNYSYAFTPLPCEICIYWAGLSRNFVYSTSETTTVYGAAGGNTQTTYAYDTTYGNLTSQSQYVNGALYRATTMEYYPTNTSTAYLVGLPARQQVKNATGTVLAESLNLYDGANTYTTAPTAGTLTATRMWTSGTQYSQITFGYDTWGNQNSVTAYSGYGSASSAPMVGAATTTTTFDSAFHVYPVSQTTPPTANAPAGLATTWAYDYNGDSVDDYILGLPTRETDPNGNQTSAQYDAFGRMTKLIRPGDSSASSTISISYSGGFPFTTTITQKIDPAQSYIVQRVYDGIGRQTKIVSGGTIVDTMYISPTVTKQSVPYTGASPNLFTITTVNPTAHTSTTTAPDGNSATTTTNGLTTIFTDARGNLTTSVSDVLGRALSVTPPTGPGVSYTYDEFDRLKTATRGGVTTTLNYDNAGRKLNMTDPDVGYWVYNYDALGNLKTQTDARGCVLTLGYDSLSRLLSKTSSGSGCGTQVNTSYTYDSGVNGKGMRTSMTDASGNSAWEYDTRGRLKKETKTLTGISPFITEWDYNSADLPTWMKYPDGEEVTSNYNDRMLLNSVIGTNTYVSSTSYDATGRMDDRLLGNGLTQNYSYYGWAEAAVVDGVSIGQGGRLKNISVGALQNLTYTYDTSGNARGIADAVSNEMQNFGYDTLDRLTSANATNGPANYSETYAYNATTGNLTTKGSLTLQYNDSAHAHAVTNAGNNAYSYDSNGNQTTRVVGGQTYTLDYDAENRLVSVTTGTQGHLPPPSYGHLPQNPTNPSRILGEAGGDQFISYHPQPLQQSGFPSTSVLDNFNRANGAIGSNWLGQNTSSFTISSNQLAINSSGLDSFAAWSSASFGADQEAYVTLSQVSANGLEQGLLLKTASDASAALKVVYVASANVVRVFTFTSAQGWVQRGSDIPVIFNNGDRFGARAKSNGDVEVYKNGPCSERSA